MKFLLFYRILFAAVLAFIFPLTLIAGKSDAIGKPVRYEIAESLLPLFQDSIPSKKKTDAKPEKSREKASREVNERLKETVGRAIKQVPRSIPKLKPKPVTDRIKIRKQ